ncbi:Arginyl-tRNA--protein transferase 1 [Gamsiella multidivaricata]|nr:Arginyl-tRNA--protein transferase 1 [Gamsiella multidivaricata]
MTETTIPEHERHGFVGFGTYHHCYYIDGKLVAVSVLDILPRCISSGHFYYDPSLSTLSLGRYSTLREIALVQEIKAIPGFEAMEYYTMGHYVSSAPKTHFKATYHPSYLLDPETYGWVPFERCIHLLQSKRYFSFSASELFNPRVKGLLITMAAEKRAREKTTRENSSAATTVKPTEHELADFCPMDTGSPTAGIEVTDIREQHQVQPQQHGHGSGLVSNDEEGYRSRKRPQDGSPVPSEYTRGGKRPSLTPPPLMSSLPLPGMMNPDDVSEQDLAQLVLFKGDKAMMLTDFEAFKTDEKVSKAMREYYAAVGPILAPRMLIFAQ